MQTITVEIKDKTALKLLKNLEELHLIKILEESKEHSFVLSGNPISEQDFKNWIEFTETLPSTTLAEAKQRWAKQKKTLQKHIR